MLSINIIIKIVSFVGSFLFFIGAILYVYNISDYGTYIYLSSSAFFLISSSLEFFRENTQTEIH